MTSTTNHTKETSMKTTRIAALALVGLGVVGSACATEAEPTTTLREEQVAVAEPIHSTEPASTIGGNEVPTTLDCSEDEVIAPVAPDTLGCVHVEALSQPEEPVVATPEPTVAEEPSVTVEVHVEPAPEPEPAPVVTAEPVCYEDDLYCWNCLTMGNGVCGPDWQPLDSGWQDAMAEGGAPDATTRDWSVCLVKVGDTTVVVCPDGWVETS